MTFRREQKVWLALGPWNLYKDALNEKWKGKKIKDSEIKSNQKGGAKSLGTRLPFNGSR